MIREDFDQTFLAAFTALAKMYGRRYDPVEMREQAEAFWTVLRAYDMDDVLHGLERWTQSQSKMPTPVEWAGLIPKQPGCARMLTPSEARDAGYAARRGGQDDPCDCPLCVDAGVSDKPLRWEPELDGRMIEVKGTDPATGKALTIGKWLHGVELARWYRSADHFASVRAQLARKATATKARTDLSPLFDETLEARLRRIFAKAPKAQEGATDVGSTHD